MVAAGEEGAHAEKGGSMGRVEEMWSKRGFEWGYGVPESYVVRSGLPQPPPPVCV